MKRKISISTIVLSVAVLIMAGTVASKIGGNAGAGGMGPGEQRSQDEELKEMVYSVNVVEADRGTVAEFIRLNGDVTAGTSLEVYPDTAGELITLHVSVGDYVRKGQIIAEVDPSRPGAVYAASPVEATISGTITRLPADIGENVNSQFSVATIGDLRNLEITGYVPERFIGGIETGLDGEITFDPYPGEIFKAEITEISPVLDTSTRTMEISMALHTDDSRVKAGMFASIKLYTDIRDNVLQLPAEAVIEGEDGHYIYVENNGAAEKRAVEIGLETVTNVQILSGLTKGESVVYRGQSLLSDGVQVKVLSE